MAKKVKIDTNKEIKRKVRTHYTGRTASPGYHCPGKTIANGRGVYCLRIGAVQVDEAIERAVLSALKHSVSRLRSPLPSGSKPITTARLRSRASRWSGQTTRLNVPSVSRPVQCAEPLRHDEL
jgi:hypothetical protein